MDGQRVFVGDKQISVYSASQVSDVLEEARRLECIRGMGCIVVDAAVHKLDSLNHGRMDA